MDLPKDNQDKLRAEIAARAINPAHESRLLSRHNLIPNTVGLAPGYLQVNLVVLPSAHASHFQDLCARNTVPCPLLGQTPIGDPTRILPEGVIKSPDFDIRTDFSSYRVFEGGVVTSPSQKDILAEWTDDSVGFLIGCSLSFEEALVENGLRVCHMEAGTVPAMYKTNIPVLPTGIFCDNATYVVSMRTYKEEEIESVRDITRPYLATHGEPVAWGWEGAKRIGIQDVHNPDFGAKQQFREGEVPVFWGCGVTPQNVVAAAGTKIKGRVMSHEPGYMLITDLTISDLPRLSGKIEIR
ncbi:hypothetical protein F4821DRAFT_189374 [Hypoxylon rubiginosum]|uniref:Uncharacterized protein n=1 Tax=Hypoxylon rubiginosum TaxID=110542 RepID=A0ACC0DGY0_9PEZI|nr:hypothetical protein F4821DRAFT_189374 [Hypoxylon rubiginosum]